MLRTVSDCWFVLTLVVVGFFCIFWGVKATPSCAQGLHLELHWDYSWQGLGDGTQDICVQGKSTIPKSSVLSGIAL